MTTATRLRRRPDTGEVITTEDIRLRLRPSPIITITNRPPRPGRNRRCGRIIIRREAHSTIGGSSPGQTWDSLVRTQDRAIRTWDNPARTRAIPVHSSSRKAARRTTEDSSPGRSSSTSHRHARKTTGEDSIPGHNMGASMASPLPDVKGTGVDVKKLEIPSHENMS